MKLKIKFQKQTHVIKLAETLSPISKKIDEVKESTQKLGEFVTEINTPHLVLGNTHNALPTENEEIHLGVIYDTSLENTLSN